MHSQHKTWEECTLPEERTPQHPVIEHHNKQTEGLDRLFRFQAAHYTIGKNFHDFVYRGQLVQANALKTAVEHWRRRKFNTAGALFWQLNDCWPVSSWAVIDSGLRPKAAYFYSKRFFAQVLVSIKINGSKIEAWGTNDSLKKFNGILQVKLLSFQGEKYSESENEVFLKPNSSAKILEFPRFPNEEERKYDSYIVAHVLSDGFSISENRFFFTEPKHLHFPNPHLTSSIIARKDRTYQLRIQTDLFAKDIRLEIDGCDAEFSENYFDLDAGGLKIIQCTVPSPSDKVEKNMRFISLQND